MVNIITLTSLIALATTITALPNHIAARQSDVSCLDNEGVFITTGVVSEAVDCINELASKGAQSCTAGLATSFCRRGNTQITGMNSIAISGQDSGSTTTTTCQDVAQAAGRVMDFCSQGSGAVKGQTAAFTNTFMTVDIRSVAE